MLALSKANIIWILDSLLHADFVITGQSQANQRFIMENRILDYKRGPNSVL